jgi:type IV secretory pathway component VirB8
MNGKIIKMYQTIQERLGLKKSTESIPSASKQSYFTQARSWADDIYTATIISRNRYQMAFFAAMGLVALSILALIVLIPLQHTELCPIMMFLNNIGIHNHLVIRSHLLIC